MRFEEFSWSSGVVAELWTREEGLIENPPLNWWANEEVGVDGFEIFDSFIITWDGARDLLLFAFGYDAGGGGEEEGYADESEDEEEDEIEDSSSSSSEEDDVWWYCLFPFLFLLDDDFFDDDDDVEVDELIISELFEKETDGDFLYATSDGEAVRRPTLPLWSPSPVTLDSIDLDLFITKFECLQFESTRRIYLCLN